MNVTGVFSDGPDFSFDNLEENSYLVEIVDGNGCAWDSTIVVNGANELFVSNEIISAASCFLEIWQKLVHLFLVVSHQRIRLSGKI